MGGGGGGQGYPSSNFGGMPAGVSSSSSSTSSSFGNGAPLTPASSSNGGGSGYPSMTSSAASSFTGGFHGFGGPTATEKNTLWMGDLEPWMDENYLKQIWFKLGEAVNVKVISDKFSGYVRVKWNGSLIIL